MWISLVLCVFSASVISGYSLPRAEEALESMLRELNFAVDSGTTSFPETNTDIGTTDGPPFEDGSMGSNVIGETSTEDPINGGNDESTTMEPDGGEDTEEGNEPDDSSGDSSDQSGDHDSENDDHDDDHDDHDEEHDEHDLGSGDVCFNFKAMVISNLAGFPGVRRMSDQFPKFNFVPLVKKSVAVFKSTHNTELAAKHVVTGLTRMSLRLERRCPSTVFNRIMLYAIGESFESLVRAKSDTYNELTKLLTENGTPLERVRYYIKRIHNELIEEMMMDVGTPLYEGLYNFMSGIYPSIVDILIEGNSSTTVQISDLIKQRLTQSPVSCWDSNHLHSVYSDAESKFTERHGDQMFTDVLDQLDMTQLPDKVRSEVRMKFKILLYKVYASADNILKAIRDKQIPIFENEMHSMLNRRQMSALKVVVTRLGWDAPQTIGKFPSVNKLMADESEEYQSLQTLRQFTKDAGMSLLKTIMDEKCERYRKYFGQELSMCN